MRACATGCRRRPPRARPHAGQVALLAARRGRRKTGRLRRGRGDCQARASLHFRSSCCQFRFLSIPKRVLDLSPGTASRPRRAGGRQRPSPACRPLPRARLSCGPAERCGPGGAARGLAAGAGRAVPGDAGAGRREGMKAERQFGSSPALSCVPTGSETCDLLF